MLAGGIQVKRLSRTPWCMRGLVPIEITSAWSPGLVLAAAAKTEVLLEVGHVEGSASRIARVAMPDALLMILGNSSQPATIPHLNIDKIDDLSSSVPLIETDAGIEASTPNLWIASAGATTARHFDLVQGDTRWQGSLWRCLQDVRAKMR